MPTVWLEYEHAVAIHADVIGTFGGKVGLRDAAALSTAMSRPRNLAQYGQRDFADLVASYAYGLLRNHPFVDGNAAVAAVLSETFLTVNGLALRASDAELAVAFQMLAAGDMSEEEMADWFRTHLS